MLLTIADFWNQCFSMWPSYLAPLLLVPHPLPPIKERTSICKAVDTIREVCCHGFWKPVTIIVVVFCIAWYHESVNTVMPNLFIKTNYWTRAWKSWVMLYVNLFCEERNPGQATHRAATLNGLASWGIRHHSSVASYFWQLMLTETSCGLPCYMSTGSWFLRRGRLDPSAQCWLSCLSCCRKWWKRQTPHPLYWVLIK